MIAALGGVGIATQQLEPAMAQEAAQTRAFDIPAQSLNGALLRFAREAGVQVLYDTALVQGRQSPGVSRRMTTSAALERLLQGSGLGFRVNSPQSISLVAPQAAAETPADTVVLDEIRLDAGGAVTEGTGSYTTGLTTVATGLPLTMKETPQSISVATRQSMDDQNQRSISEVLEDTAGITVMPMDTERRSVYARGFSSPTYMVDGLPVWYRIQYGSGPSMADMAIYDRVEVLRGATGLMAGAGEPSVVVNMVRKTPTATPQTQLRFSAGSWNTVRSDLDISGPLNADGSIRGRFVAAHEQGDSWLDRYERRKTVLYGTVEADVGDAGTLSAGYDFQRSRTRNHQFGGLPLIANDGSQLDYDTSTNAGGGNLPLTQTTQTLFLRYAQDFGTGWQAVGDLSFYKAERKGYLASASWGSPDPQGYGVQTVGGYADTDTEQTALSLTASGPVELWGRSHDLRFGITGNWGKDNHKAYSAFDGTEIDYQPITGSIFDWDGHVPNLIQQAGYVSYVSDTEIDQVAAYGSGRFGLTDRLNLIAGARVVWYDYDYTTKNLDSGATTHQQISRNGEWIPYAGLTYDLNDDWSVYASYTRVFKQASYRDKDNRIVEPTTGSNYELGTKASFADDRLNFAAAIYLLEQDNLPVRDRSVSYQLPDGSNPYKSIDGTRSKGFEMELAGEIRPNIQLAASYAYTTAKDGDGLRISTVTPRHSVKLSGVYAFETMPLTLGASLRWQSAIENTWVWPVTGTARQGSYAVVGLMARYDFRNGMSASLNIENLFDRKYLSSIDETYATGNYGAPRNATLSLDYRF
nr:TonB-dependent receptor [Paracoccus binzhouensis]